MPSKEYSKRLSRYCKLEILQVTDEDTGRCQRNSGVTDQGKRKDRGSLSLIRDDAYVIALAIEGKMLDSGKNWQKELKIRSQRHQPDRIVIGGSLGTVCPGDEAGQITPLAFSRMTFPHQLMRVVLLEQIYRSYRITNHQPYHK